jgi:isorenieratene synthase
LSLRLVPSADGSAYEVQAPAFPRVPADHVVVATDVDALRNLLHASPALHDADDVAGLMRMRTSSVTVLRFVLGRTIDDHLAIFQGFELLDALFNVTKLQGVKLSRYAGKTHEVIELQLYRNQAIGLLSRDEIVRRVRRELTAAYRWSEEPEVLEPVHLAFNRNVYSGFDVESEAVRIGTVPSVPGLYFAGDWVQPDEGAWYMERAVRTGRLAARAILKAEGDRVEKVPLEPPVRTAWQLRTLARRGGERGLSAVSRALMALLDLREGG